MTQKHRELTSVFCLFIVHITLAILAGAYFDSHEQLKYTFATVFPIMMGLWILAFNKQRGAIWKVIWSYTRRHLLTWKGVKKISLSILFGILMSGAIFYGFEKLDELGLFILPKTNCSSIDIEYLFASVPGQQLIYFIWPLIILEKYISRWKLMILFPILFGLLHGYYDNWEIVILAGACLGIPSAILCFYRDDFYASIINHMIVGYIAIRICFVI